MTNKSPFPPPSIPLSNFSLQFKTRCSTINVNVILLAHPNKANRIIVDLRYTRIDIHIYIYGCERISQKALCFFLPASVSTSSLHFLSVSALSKGCFGPGQSKRERKARIKRERTPESFIPPFRLVNRVNAATYCDLGGRTLATNCPITFPVSYSQVRKTPGVPLAPLQVWTAQPTFVAAFQTICVKWPVADYTHSSLASLIVFCVIYHR